MTSQTRQIRGQQIFIGQGQEYYFGASSSPSRVIITDVKDGLVFYRGYPYKVTSHMDERIFRDLAYSGSTTWLKSGYAHYYPESAENLNNLLVGKPGIAVDIEDEQRIIAEIKAPGNVSDYWSLFDKFAPNSVHYADSYAENDGSRLCIACSKGDLKPKGWLSVALVKSGFKLVGYAEELNTK